MNILAGVCVSEFNPRVDIPLDLNLRFECHCLSGLGRQKLKVFKNSFRNRYDMVEYRMKLTDEFNKERRSKKSPRCGMLNLTVGCIPEATTRIPKCHTERRLCTSCYLEAAQLSRKRQQLRPALQLFFRLGSCYSSSDKIRGFRTHFQLCR